MDGIDEQRMAYSNLDSEKIEQEMLMERIRVSSQKRNWDQFHQYVHRNIRDKCVVLGVDDREDLTNAIDMLKKYLPNDTNRDVFGNMRTLADSLSYNITAQQGCIKLKGEDFVMELVTDGTVVNSCLISWYGERFIEAIYLRNLMNKGNWEVVLANLNFTIRLMPSNLSREEKNFCLRCLDCLEKDLLNASANSLPLIRKINESAFGYCVPRSESTPFTIYFSVNPSELFDSSSSKFIVLDEKVLKAKEFPCAYLNVIESPQLNHFVDSSQFLGEGRMSLSGRDLPSAYCLKFSKPIVFSRESLKKLAMISETDLKVEFHTNIYKYLCNSNDENLTGILVNLNISSKLLFTLDDSMLNGSNDGVLREITFKHPQDVAAILEIVRIQLMHNALFESFVRMESRDSSAEGAIEIRVCSDSTSNMDFFFKFGRNRWIARINLWNYGMDMILEDVMTEFIFLEMEDPSIILSKYWSVVVMMRNVLQAHGLNAVKPYTSIKCETPLNMQILGTIENEIVDCKNDVKVSKCWLDMMRNGIRKSHRVADDKFSFKVDENVEKLLDDKPALSLITLLKELDEVDELIPPPAIAAHSSIISGPPRMETLVQRTNRPMAENSMTFCALSDLDAICDMAADCDTGESNMSDQSGRSSIVERCSPSTAEVQRIRQQVPSQSPSSLSDRYRNGQLTNMPQVSPLELSRSRISATHSTQPTTSTDVFDFDEPSRMSANFSTASPFQYPINQQVGYNYPNMPIRGGMTTPLIKRRGRGRKVGNIGDRMLDHSNSVIDPITGLVTNRIAVTTRKPRGTSTPRRPRRPRKAAQIVGPQIHTHQFSLSQPLLHRSYSETQCAPPLSTASAPCTATTSLQLPDTDLIEGSSDEETDPPPPYQHMAATTSSTSTTSSTISSSGLAATTTAPSIKTTPPLSTSTHSIISSPLGKPVDSKSSTTQMISTQTLIPPMIRSDSHPQVQRPRKGSLEAVVGKLHCKSSAVPPVTQAQAINPYAASDLYDDESESTSVEVSNARKEKPPTPSLSASVSTGARASPNTKIASTGSLEQSQSSDLKIMIKIKTQKSPHTHSSSSQHSSNISPPVVRLTGQPPSSSVRCRDEKALLKQKQLREKSRIMQEERNRKALKRERKAELAKSSKKPRLERPSYDPRASLPPSSSTASRMNFPHLPFANFKNFKIPKVMENEKCDSPAPSQTSISINPPAVSITSSASSSHSNTLISSVPSSSSSIFPPKPVKSILKPPSIDTSSMYRSGSMPHMISSRRALLPDPRSFSHHPRQIAPPRMLPPMGAAVPPSAGRWMTLAPQKQSSPRSPFETLVSASTLKSPEASSSYSKTSDSPSEGLKIVADDD